MVDVGGPNAFMPYLLGIFAVFMFIGLVATALVPETKGKTLEDLSGENDTELVDLALLRADSD